MAEGTEENGQQDGQKEWQGKVRKTIFKSTWHLCFMEGYLFDRRIVQQQTR